MKGSGEEKTDACTSGTSVEMMLLGKTNEKESITDTVPFYKLFAFADLTDHILMITGTVSAIANGICLPLMSLLLGEVINAFGHNQNNIHRVVNAVSKVSLKFAYLAVGCGVVSFVQVSSWMITGERQAARIRSLYLKNILRQDISFFDKETNTGEVVGRISGDTVRIQDAMGEKVCIFSLELIARMVPVVLRFFTFSPHLLKIACVLPMVCHFVTRIVP
ncbi:putative ABC transporter type 1, transmembrane domain-containing protein [Helianthus annuus]|uniref:ABC transporter type 1, transmembrane domain-containing protein n=1 Tax=Helianthus annuus TaxID=4232 RepID=A0A9K3DY92_HELAN|nr:putative ABC transporter type 1, transmembrane domain-containing protein [Helianthus annuus]KAJ0449781.1 putative ABC transporter type 1, transmembrane domain-containing protein [Helianthus annuus]KAJ0471478.1 putative ABC transporter type 1, transmembrane domain-containing protein [Helianthus annuus]